MKWRGALRRVPVELETHAPRVRLSPEMVWIEVHELRLDTGRRGA